MDQMTHNPGLLWVTGSYWNLVRPTGNYVAQNKKTTENWIPNFVKIPQPSLIVGTPCWPSFPSCGLVLHDGTPSAPQALKLIAVCPSQILNPSYSVTGSTSILCCVLTLPLVYTLRGFVFTILLGPTRPFPNKSLVCLERLNRRTPWVILFQKHLIFSLSLLVTYMIKQDKIHLK